MSDQSQQDRIDELFDQAVELKSEERAAFLIVACNSDDELLAEVKKLLAAHDCAEKAPRFLSSPPPEKRLIGGLETVPGEPAHLGDNVSDRSMAKGRPKGTGSSRFQILRFLDEGGLGKVSIALDTELRREVAFKEIRDRFADDSSCQSRFLLEAEVTGRLEHPGVVPVYGLGRFDNGRPFYAMRLIQGENLAEASENLHQHEQDREKKRITLRRLIERFLDVCDAVGYAHARGIVHRDLKPQNIMLGKFGETLVLDWGLTKSLEHGHRPDDSEEETLRPDGGSDSAPTIYGKAIGSPWYMSPEQAAGKLDEIGTATDVFGLGATLYHLLSGFPPIEADNREAAVDKAMHGDIAPPRDRNADVPIALNAICMKAIAKNPHDRYASVWELRAAVQDWLDNEPISDLLAAVKHFEALLEEHPNRAAYQERLGRELSVLSKVLQSLARYEDSWRYAERSVELLEGLFRHRPTDLGRYEELSLARAQLASIHRAMAREDQARQLDELNKSDFTRLIEQSYGTREVHEELITLSMHQGFSLAEAEKLLKHHLSAADTIDFVKDGKDPPTYGAFNIEDSFQKLFRTITGESRYEVLGTLGTGGAGVVYRARDKLLPRIVALKAAPTASAGGSRAGYGAHLFFEACVLARLSHPNIVPIYELGLRENGVPFFTMKFVQGQNWSDLAKDRPSSTPERLAYWRRLLRGFVQVCEAIHYAHQCGVIHGDPKPSNVVVDDEGRPWIIDWGIALSPDQTLWPSIETAGWIHKFFFPRHEEGQIRGTPAYMSPEQAQGKMVDTRSDVFILGASLFTLLTGRAPYAGQTRDLVYQRASPDLQVPSPRTVDRRIPSRLAAICVKAMAPNPLHRHQTVMELGIDVRRWLEEKPWSTLINIVRRSK